MATELGVREEEEEEEEEEESRKMSWEEPSSCRWMIMFVHSMGKRRD